MAFRIQANDREVALFLQDLAGPERRAFIKETADEVFGEARAQNRAVLGYAPPETLRTDGTVGKAPEDMAVGGHSTLSFDLAGDVIAFTMELARRLSPRSGSNRKSRDETFAESHVAIVDGAVLPAPYRTGAFQRAVIYNLQPYNRKIERGLSRQRPNGVYEALVLPEVKKRYGALYFVAFAYEAGLVAPFGKKSGIVSDIERRRGKGARNRRRRRQFHARDRVPALIIEPR